jgi:S-methylmethionine-dependent homocysteine/selenocysteine methylase
MKRFNLIDLWKEKKRPLILDGAMGSALQDKIKDYNLLWSSWLNIENPDAVLSLHKEYIKSGAEIITTNTFRTNPHFYHKYDLKYSLREFVTAGVHIAKIARGDKKVLIAGCNPPAEDCYQAERTITPKEIASNHRDHIDLLIETGADFVLNETQSHLDEIEIICRHCHENRIPFVVSILVNDNLRILSGEDIRDVIKYIIPFEPLAIAFNCFSPKLFEKLIKVIPNDFNTGFYFNCGSGAFTDKDIKCHISPDDYISTISKYITKNSVFIGSCCGSNPNHTERITAFFDAKN